MSEPDWTRPVLTSIVGAGSESVVNALLPAVFESVKRANVLPATRPAVKSRSASTNADAVLVPLSQRNEDPPAPARGRRFQALLLSDHWASWARRARARR